MARFNYMARLRRSMARWIQATFNYGSVEGVLYIDGAPAPAGIRLACVFIDADEYEKDGSFWFGRKFTRTSEGGRYRFPFIPAGEAGLGRCYESVRERPADVERRVEVRVGETTALDLGLGAGQVSGRFVYPDDYSGQKKWSELPGIWLECMGPCADGAQSQLVEYSGSWRMWEPTDDSWKRNDERWYFVPGVFIRICG